MLWIVYIALAAITFMLIRLETLLVKILDRITEVKEQSRYDWAGISAELAISAYKREGGLICRADMQFNSLTSALTMPITGDWLIFEAEGRTLRGEVTAREVYYGEDHPSSRFPGDTASTRTHMRVRVDVICDDAEGWSPDVALKAERSR